MVPFDQYRFLKQPEKKMCEGDRLWLALRFKALHCFKVSFGSPVPRDGSTVSSFSDQCNPILLRDSTSCINQMSPSSKLALYFQRSAKGGSKNLVLFLVVVHCLRGRKITVPCFLSVKEFLNAHPLQSRMFLFAPEIGFAT